MARGDNYKLVFCRVSIVPLQLALAVAVAIALAFNCSADGVTAIVPGEQD